MALWNRLLLALALALFPVMPVAALSAGEVCAHQAMGAHQAPGADRHQHHAPSDSSAAARSCCALCLVMAVPTATPILENDRLPIFSVAWQQALEAAGVEPADPPPRV